MVETAKTRDFHHRNITDWMVQHDTYRDMLPPAAPPIPANRRNLAAWVITDCTARGDRWNDVLARIRAEILTWAGPADKVHPAIGAAPPTWSCSDYVMNVLLGQVWIKQATPIVQHFTPQNAAPQTMSVVRWPYLHEQSWGITWEGQCMGHGQSLIHSRNVSTTLYSHEMGHSMHLVHFLGGNFGWKHHDLNFPNCMMSYTHIEQSIPKPVGAVGGNGALAAGGRPDAGTVVGTRRIRYPTRQSLAQALDKPCARCMLKLQGWNEEVLPAAWTRTWIFSSDFRKRTKELLLSPNTRRERPDAPVRLAGGRREFLRWALWGTLAMIPAKAAGQVVLKARRVGLPDTPHHRGGRAA